MKNKEEFSVNYIIEKNGGQNIVAEKLGVTLRSVQYWRSNKKIPSKYLEKMGYKEIIVENKVNFKICKIK